LEKLARIFFIFTMIFAAAFIIFFLLYFRNSNEAEKYRIEKANLSQQVETLTMELNRVNVTNQELEKKLVKYTQTGNVNGITDAATYTAKINTLNTEIDRLEDELEKKSASINVLSNQIESLSKEKNTEITQASTVSNTAIAEMKLVYEKEIEKYQNELFDKNKEIDRLKEQLGNIDYGDQRIKDLQQRVADIQKSLDETRKERDLLIEESDGKDIEIASLNKKISDLSDSGSAIQTLEEEILGYKNDIQKLNVSIDSLKAQIVELNSVIDGNDIEITALKKQIETEKRYEPIPPGEEDALRYKYLLLGEDMLSSGNNKESARYFEDARLETLALSDLSKVYEKKRTLAYRKAIAEYYTEGYSFYKSKSYGSAIPLFENAVRLSKTVDNDYYDDSVYYLGLSYFNVKDYNSAEMYFRMVYEMENSILSQHALYYLVRTYVDLGDSSNAVKFAQLLVNYDSYKDYAQNIINKFKG